MAHVQKEMPALKRAALQVVSGGSAGFVEVCIMQPLDVVKTRMQLQNVRMGTGVLYRGVFDCFSKMYKNEGLFSFWKGVLPPIIAETPKRAVKFVCFEQFKPLFQFGSPTPTPLTFSLAGLCAGLTEGVVINPFEVVKVTQQADHAHIKKAASTWTVTSRIVRTHGFGPRGLTKGLIPTMARAGAFNMVYFGFYHSVRIATPVLPNPTHEFLRKIAIGFTSGVLGCLVNTPIDVAKSRIQGPQPNVGYIKYRSLIQSIATVQSEEGFRALYKGFVPKVMRLGPGGAIMLLVFENVYELLQERYA